jgi:hypothetical protein
VKVCDLIAALSEMPPTAEVWHLWDGEARTQIEHVWLARSGAVVTADNREVAYSTEDRPESAPTEEQDQYWKTPEQRRTA